MCNYIFSDSLAAFLRAATRRMKGNMGSVLLLEGEPGGGKTAFAEAMAQKLGGRCFYYSGSPDRERDLLYEIDVQGVLKRENAWVPGPAWEAFQATADGSFAVLLIDEVDKTNPGFDAFLLRLLENFAFRAPDGSEVHANPEKLAVILTTNGRRKLRPEVMRRCQRINVPLPTGERLKSIIRGIAGEQVVIPDGLLDLAIRVADKIREVERENAPSPKELALLCVDLLGLVADGETSREVWREIAASWLVKTGGPNAIDSATRYDWTKALLKEAKA